MVVPACDNVGWGGIDVSLQPPPSQGEGADSSVVEPHPATLPSGPVLLAGSLTPSGLPLAPLGFVDGDSIIQLPGPDEPELRRLLTSERLVPGREFNLFAAGVRVGTFLAMEVSDNEPGFCPAQLVLKGTAELTPEAADVTGFLALGKTPDEPVFHQPYSPLATQRRQRAATLNLASTQIGEIGAIWPPSILNIRRDVQMFRLDGERTAVAATFLYRDELTVNQAPAGAYSLFLIGEDTGAAWETSFVGYRRVSIEGKGAPRLHQHLDWDNDGVSEVVLEVLGTDHRWYTALQHGMDGYETILDTECPPPAA